MQSVIDENEKILACAKRTYDMISEAMKSSSSSSSLATKRTKIDTNATVLKNDIDNESTATTSSIVTPTNAGRNKKHLTRPRILTFTAAHDRFARLQLLSTHTLYDLVSTLCKYTSIGYEGADGPDDHLWYITYNGLEYESSDIECQSPLRANRTRLVDLSLEKGSTLKLTYDYGTTSQYDITLVSVDEDLSSQDITSFPRNRPRSVMPASYEKYEPEDTHTTPSNLDERFQNLNTWIFDKGSNVSVNLFQGGRKKNFGHMDNQFTMLYLPVKPDDLANWLNCFNVAASIKPAGIETDGYEHYTWQSVVPLPRSKLTTQLSNKYKSNERRGFCDAPIVEEYSYYKGEEDAPTIDLEKVFPKIAALAGITKDKNVPKGWICFTNRGDQCSLAICKGITAEPKKSKAPKGLAFEGKNQHTPVEDPLFQISGNLDIHGLHDLFCVVEGLLMTL